MFYNKLKTQFEIPTSTQHFEKKKNNKLLFVILKQNTEMLYIMNIVSYQTGIRAEGKVMARKGGGPCPFSLLNI